MERTTKKTLGKMIGEMLQVDNLNANQMQIIDLLCQINESDEIASNTVYYANNNRVDEFAAKAANIICQERLGVQNIKGQSLLAS